MLAVCAGMHRSGSTWQFMVVLDLLSGTGRRVENLQYIHGVEFAARAADAFDPAVDYVVKTHDAHPAFAAAAAAGAAVLYSYRDLRDVAYSFAHKVGRTFHEVVEADQFLEMAAANDRFWAGLPGAVAQRYEDWVVDARPAVRAIAARLGLTLGSTGVERVVAEYSFARNRERMNQLAAEFRAAGMDLSDPQHVLARDPATQLHWNHLRDGRAGGWRDRATADEVAALRRHAGPWLVARGYEPNDDWAAAPAGRAECGIGIPGS